MEDLLLAAAAVIVTYNSEDVIDKCLDALADMAPGITRIVVDNASGDHSVARIRTHTGVRLMPSPDNVGFAAAVNQAIRASDADLFLLLNPDAELVTSVDSLLEASRKYGLAGGKLVDAEGRAQSGFTIRRFPTPASLIFELFGINRLWRSNPVNRRYRYLDRDLDKTGAVDQPAGAFLMFRRDVWERLGGFDETFYPIWFEDVDFCRRAASAGFRTEYVPSAIARHAGGHSVTQVPAGCRAVYWCVSLLRYAAKHFRTIGYRGVCAAVVLSSVPRMVAGMIRGRSLTLITDYSKIIRIAALCLVSSRRHAVGRVRFS